MDYLNVNNLFETQKGFACSISSQYSLYTIYIFNSIQTKYYLYREYNVYKGLSEWYDNTFLMQYNINNRKRERLRTGQKSDVILQRADIRWESVNPQVFITRELLRG